MVKPPAGSQLNAGHPSAFGLSHFFPMWENGGTMALDIIANNTIANFGGVDANTWSTGRFGTCIAHPGQTTRGIQPTPVFGLTTNWSWDAWLLTNGQNGGASSYQNLFSPSATVGLWIQHTSGYYLNFYSGGDHIDITDLGTGKWHHVVLTHAGDGTPIKYYVDGKFSSSTSNLTIAINVTEFFQDGGGGSEGFNGLASYYRFWNKVLTWQEINDLYVNPFSMFLMPRRRNITQQSGGIAFDAASNSGDQAMSANYTFNRTVTGSNTFLAVNVELLTLTSATVTSVTDDDGGSNTPLVFIGAKSTVSGAGRVEMWGLKGAATGTKAIRVILSGPIESAATAISYTGVNQTSPTEGFNSAQATNVGAADATVDITTVADNDWVIAACVTDDTSITANNTPRNNISGSLGSGADEDTNAVVTPPGVTTMSFTNVAALKTWAIAGYGIRPIGSANLGSRIYRLLLLGVA